MADFMGSPRTDTVFGSLPSPHKRSERRLLRHFEVGGATCSTQVKVTQEAEKRKGMIELMANSLKLFPLSFFCCCFLEAASLPFFSPFPPFLIVQLLAKHSWHLLRAEKGGGSEKKKGGNPPLFAARKLWPFINLSGICPLCFTV